jgi:hypothetical protein
MRFHVGQIGKERMWPDEIERVHVGIHEHAYLKWRHRQPEFRISESAGTNIFSCLLFAAAESFSDNKGVNTAAPRQWLKARRSILYFSVKAGFQHDVGGTRLIGITTGERYW